MSDSIAWSDIIADFQPSTKHPVTVYIMLRNSLSANKLYNSLLLLNRHIRFIHFLEFLFSGFLEFFSQVS